MLPPIATIEAIKAHQLKVEKDKITPDNFPPYRRSSVDSNFFKIHAYRERRFLIIIEMLIKAAFLTKSDHIRILGNNSKGIHILNRYWGSLICCSHQLRTSFFEKLS